MIQFKNIKTALLSIALLTIIFTGSLQAQERLYLVHLNSNPDRQQLPDEKVSALQEGHLENIRQLYDAGHLLLAGPFDDGGGIFVLKAENTEAVNDLLSTDPAIKANRLNIEVMPMIIDKGMICQQDKPYEMTALHFIRFTHTGRQPSEDMHKRISKTEAYRDKNALIFACSLSNESGPAAFVEILGTEHDADKYAAGHPMVSSGAFEYTVRPWWGNNKSFCNDKSKKLNY
ncbi:MAG: YciI family protein [Bacteroidales bacterium]|nr:YciI family protein [Bacteroidales bacterium]